MKRLFYLFSITFLILQSCSSDSSDGNASSTQLVGKWEGFQVASFPPGTIIDASSPLMNVQFECSTKKSYYQFGSQGSFKAVDYYVNCAEGGGIGTYTKTDDVINIYQNNILQVTWEIISLTNTTLKLKETTSDYIMVTSYKKI
jgi:hypothetical protein